MVTYGFPKLRNRQPVRWCMWQCYCGVNALTCLSVWQSLARVRASDVRSRSRVARNQSSCQKFPSLREVFQMKTGIPLPMQFRNNLLQSEKENSSYFLVGTFLSPNKKVSASMCASVRVCVCVCMKLYVVAQLVPQEQLKV